MGFNDDSILKNNILTGTQDDTSALISRTSGTQDDTLKLTWRTGDSKKSPNAPSYKRHKKNLVTNYPLQKYPIHQR